MLSWKFERSIHSVRLMADFAAEAGLSCQSVLAGTGLDEAQLLDPNTVVSGHQELQLIRNLVQQLGHYPALGLAVGMRYHFTSFGPLGMALISSANVREALDLALQYFHLTFAFTRFVVADTPEATLIYIEDAELPTELRQFIIERDVAALLTVQRDLLQDSLCTQLAFSFQPSSHIQSYIDLFGVTPQFGATKSVVMLDSAKINQPLQLANQLALHAAQAQCKQVLDQRQAQHNITTQVRQHLMTTRGYMPTMDEVANRLYLNLRTLRRYLAQEQITFIQIREDVRQLLAAHYLELPHASIEQIAEWLGYAEPASFINAYKRWHGNTPHAARLLQRRQTGGRIST